MLRAVDFVKTFHAGCCLVQWLLQAKHAELPMINSGPRAWTRSPTY